MAVADRGLPITFSAWMTASAKRSLAASPPGTLAEIEPGPLAPLPPFPAQYQYRLILELLMQFPQAGDTQAVVVIFLNELQRIGSQWDGHTVAVLDTV